MNAIRIPALAVLALGLVAHLPAQPVLSIDFNDRSNDSPANTQTGFSSFVLDGSTEIWTAPVSRSFGPFTVTVSSTAGIGFDDRYRTAPTDGGALTESLLLRDFIFSRENAGTEGLTVQISGLEADAEYAVILWSYDNGSPGRRVSDWYVNGLQVVTNYTFDGRVLPTANEQYRLMFHARADASGQMWITGRRNPASVDGANAASFGVFLNALQLTPVDLAEPPTIVAHPGDVDAYAGESARFAVGVNGTFPMSYQWWHGTNLLDGATNSILVLTNVQAADAGGYSVVVNNTAGQATSAEAILTVLPVENLTTALLAHWPLDVLDAVTPDVSGGGNDLTATNLTAADLQPGHAGQSVFFNAGANPLLYREVGGGSGLPAYAHPSYTVALWVKGSFQGQADRRVYSESASTNSSILVNIGTDSATTDPQPVVDIYIRDNAGSARVGHRKSVLPAFDGQWHHIAWVDDKGLARLYVDGAQDPTDFSYTRGLLTPNLVSVGGIIRSNGLAALFTGQIDEVTVWARALTPAEVSEVHLHGLAGPPQPATLTRIDVTETTVAITFTSASSGASFRVEQSDTLDPALWSEVQGVILTDPADNTYLASFARPQGGQKFYRVVTSP